MKDDYEKVRLSQENALLESDIKRLNYNYEELKRSYKLQTQRYQRIIVEHKKENEDLKRKLSTYEGMLTYRVPVIMSTSSSTTNS